MNDRTCLAAALVTLTVAAAASAQTVDANPTVSTFINHGPSANRVDLVVIGDGYTASQRQTYDTNLKTLTDYLFGDRVNDPYVRYKNFFNVYQVNVVSQQSGADKASGTTSTADTALNSTYYYDGVTDRLLYFNTTLANNAVTKALSGTGVTPEMRIGIVNSATYGGGGGQWAVYAGSNGQARQISPHEVGHSFAGLADEYDYGGAAVYAGGEPAGANLTKDATGAKWSQWNGYDDPYHNGTHGTANLSPVGAYQGGGYSTTGIYRPTSDSMMRTLNVPLNAPSREATILKIYSLVDPLDGYQSNAATLVNPDSISVSRLDLGVIKLDWFVDGTLRVDDAPTDVLSIASLGLAPGAHTIRALAYDGVIDLANTGLDFDWVRKSLDHLQQSVTYAVTIVPEPAALAAIAVLLAPGRRRRA